MGPQVPGKTHKSQHDLRLRVELLYADVREPEKTAPGRETGSLDNNEDDPLRKKNLKAKRVARNSGAKRLPDESQEEDESLQPSGDPSAVAPPVPIPNTEVKRCSPDDSVSIGYAKVGRRQSYAPFLAKAGNGALSFSGGIH